MEGDLPDQNRLIETVAMEGALHFVTGTPIGRCESNSLCARTHFRDFVSDLQSHYPGFSWNGFLAGDAIRFDVQFGFSLFSASRHFQTPPLSLTAYDFSSLSTICSYFLLKSGPNFISTSSKVFVRLSSSDFGITFSLIGKSR